MNITKQISEITWKFYYPPEFPCGLCFDHRATKHVKLLFPETGEANFVLCEDCSRLSPETLWLMTHEEVKK